MPMIKPSSDLRNKYNEISEYCNKFNEPIFITKNGSGDLVVLSIEQYDVLCGKAELHQLLNAGLADIKNGKSRLAEDVFKDLEERFGMSDV